MQLCWCLYRSVRFLRERHMGTCPLHRSALHSGWCTNNITPVECRLQLVAAVGVLQDAPIREQQEFLCDLVALEAEVCFCQQQIRWNQLDAPKYVGRVEKLESCSGDRKVSRIGKGLRALER
jgi:hypothetical protein